MKPEAKNWIGLAEEDYHDSLYLFKAARYPNAVYLLCQAIEKLLKAIQVEIASQPPQKTLIQFVKNIPASIKVDQVIVFGSYLEGTARPDSDIDVIVVSDDFRGM